MKLALEEAGGKVGDYHDQVRLARRRHRGGRQVGARPGLRRTPARPSATTSAIAYLGEFNSGASAISIPILNEAGILQVSPSNTYVGLTRAEGAEKGEPDKYYPTGKRTYGRVVPADHIQAAASGLLHEGPGLHEALHPERQGGLRQGPRRPGREDRRRAGPRGPRQRRHRHQGGQLPRAGRQDQVRRRRLLLLRRHHAEQGRPGVQGRRRGQPGHQDVRPGRRRRVGVHREARLRRSRSRPSSRTRRSIRSSTRRPLRSSSTSSRRSTARTRSRTRSTATRP